MSSSGRSAQEILDQAGRLAEELRGRRENLETLACIDELRAMLKRCLRRVHQIRCDLEGISAG